MSLRYAKIGFQRAQENIQNDPNNRHQGPKWTLKRASAFLIAARWVQRGRNKGKECGQRSARWAEEAPKRPQEGAKGARVGPKRTLKMKQKVKTIENQQKNNENCELHDSTRTLE